MIKNEFQTRREMLSKFGAGFGSIALSGLLQNERLKAGQKAHRVPTAKNIIFLFMEGGPSAMDLFDPKPKLRELAGQPLPDSFGPIITPMGEYNAPLLADKRKWKQHGEAGTWVSDWLPNIATCVDDIAVIRSLHGNGLNHSNGVCQMNTCSIRGGRPSLGSWVSYGLGTENSNLPGFVVIEDVPNKVFNKSRNWSAGFMPAVYQGTALYNTNPPIRNLAPPTGVSSTRQQEKLKLLTAVNKQHAGKLSKEQSELEARIESFELAYRMQQAAPNAVDLASETDETKKLYGMDSEDTQAFGKNCLLARRLVERGVRFVQLYHGCGSKWDAHTNIESNHTKNCKASDKPVAGLIKDLKRRGLLDETLVIWGGEFGRTPMSEKGTGRDHNAYGFTMFMAGGGVKGGQVIGSTDEVGLHAVEDRMHIKDLHTTILYLLGIDNMELVYHHQGRPERPTLNEGSPMLKLLG
ncbi:MAG: hypothetical protein CMJ76_10400 [Planctomycetaceae bacterium]|nr:hypothetical protein [Planctomycetaceae bacterium]